METEVVIVIGIQDRQAVSCSILISALVAYLTLNGSD